MTPPQVLVLAGYGINCDEETKFAFEKAGARADILHINDLIDNPQKLSECQIFTFPGGFSYGDDTGSGNALAYQIRNHLWEEMIKFIEEDHLALGICNGFQVMVNLGLLPALKGKYGERRAALVHNDSARYTVRWVDLQFQGNSPWTKGIENISLPIAHGEGKFFTDDATLTELRQKELIAARYVAGEICRYQDLLANPNGSLDNIAGITDETGRILGMMPHPERAIDFTHLPHWTLLKEHLKREKWESNLENNIADFSISLHLPQDGPGLKIFENAVKYFE